MSDHVSGATSGAKSKPATKAANGSKQRQPAKPHQVLVVMQVLDEQGNPMPFTKDRVRVLKFANAARADVIAALDTMEAAHHSFYIKGEIPAGR